MQGFIPGVFGISHGAFQFVAYEELKTLYNQYRQQPIDSRLVRFCIVYVGIQYHWLAKLCFISMVFSFFPKLSFLGDSGVVLIGVQLLFIFIYLFICCRVLENTLFLLPYPRYLQQP